MNTDHKQDPLALTPAPRLLVSRLSRNPKLSYHWPQLNCTEGNGNIWLRTEHGKHGEKNSIWNDGFWLLTVGILVGLSLFFFPKTVQTKREIDASHLPGRCLFSPKHWCTQAFLWLRTTNLGRTTLHSWCGATISLCIFSRCLPEQDSVISGL